MEKLGLDTIELILWSEQEFEIDISGSDTVNIFTVGQFSRYINQKLFDLNGSATTTEAEIFEKIKSFLVSELRIPPDKIDRDSNFVKDLRLDQ